MGPFAVPGVIQCTVTRQNRPPRRTLARMKTSILRVVLLLVIGLGTAVTLLGAGQNTHYWGELTTPALFLGALLAYGLGSLVFTPRRRRR